MLSVDDFKEWRELGKGAYEVIDFAGSQHGIHTPEGGEDMLADFVTVALVFNDLKVLVTMGVFDTYEHSGFPSPLRTLSWAEAICKLFL
jgi:hypothetical protein